MVNEGTIKIEVKVLTLSNKIAKQILNRPAIDSPEYKKWFDSHDNPADGVERLGYVVHAGMPIVLLRKGNELRFDSWGNWNDLNQIFLV